MRHLCYDLYQQRCFMAKKKYQEDENVELKIASPEEEQKKLDESLDLIPLCTEKSEEDFATVVEKERSNIFVTYKKARRENNIIMVITVLIFIASMVVMSLYKDTWGLIAGGVAIGVTLVVLIVHYILTRNLFPNTTKKYIRSFMVTADNYVFDIENVTNQKLYFEKRYAIAEIVPDKLYKDVVDIASRNIVTGTYKNQEFECGELALYLPGAKKYQKNVIFVGKYLSLKNELHFEDRYVIRIKGEKEMDTPNAIDDLAVLSEQNRFVIYGKEGSEFEKDLGKELIENLKSIDCAGALLNVNIVFWAGRTSVYLSYDDSIVAIPFEQEIKAESYQQLKKNIKELLEILVG